jgi:superoxide reductase
MKLGDILQSADWKKEKHVPVIECPDTVAPDDPFAVQVSVGKEIPHPNTTEHHIRWIDVYFKPEDDKFAYQVARFDFSAHGESARGPNEGPVYANPSATLSMKVMAPGTLIATSFCNIHGLWESSKDIAV